MEPVPRLVVEATFRTVYIKYRTGTVKRLQHTDETILEEGCILYLDFDSTRGFPVFGYVLSEEDTAAKKMDPDDVIEILDVSDDDGKEDDSNHGVHGVPARRTVELSDYGTDECTAPDDPLDTSWSIIEADEDLNQLTARQAKYIAKTLGIDTCGFLEKSEFVRALKGLKETGRAEWLSRRRSAEEAYVAEQNKLSKFLNNQRRLEAEEKKQKDKALRKVKSLTDEANLIVFLRRIGVKVDARARCIRADLKRAHRDTLLKYHPDKIQARSKPYERFLAEDITKWVTLEC